MKTTKIILALACIVATASAEVYTDFAWENGAAGTLTDNSGVNISFGDAVVLTYVSDDNVINFDPNAPLSNAYGNDVLVYDLTTSGPPPAANDGVFTTSYMSEDITTGTDYRGKYVYAVVFDMVYNTYSGLASISEGTYFAVGNISSEALSDQTTGLNPPQDFDPGYVQTTQQVIPEPAVASLIGLFGGGLIFARRMFTKGA